MKTPVIRLAKRLFVKFRNRDYPQWFWELRKQSLKMLLQNHELHENEQEESA